MPVKRTQAMIHFKNLLRLMRPSEPCDSILQNRPLGKVE